MTVSKPRRTGLLAVWLAALWCVQATGSTVRGQSPASIESLLAAAGAYLDQFGRDLDGVVFEEDYFQQSQGQALVARRLKSDMVVLSDPATGWVEFRDTNSVDGKPVADRQARIADLFAAPNANALAQARRIVKEGARFNVAGVGFQLDRTINLPMAALMFLRAENQRRSTFARSRAGVFDGRDIMAVDFKETSKPRLIGTIDGAAAQGTFWIVPETGAVLRTDLRLESARGAADVTASIHVAYGLVPTLQLWLPKTMDETYIATSGIQLIGAINGHATYGNFRKFNVAVDEKTGN